MQVVELTEWEWKTVALSDEQAVLLDKIGEKLASVKSWWGSDSEESPKTRRVIERSRTSVNGQHRVRVRDAVGAIGLGELQLNVSPKIPMKHFLYLLEQSRYVPQTSNESVGVSSADGFHELVARWFNSECLKVIQLDLLRDYETATENIPAIKGRVHLTHTTRNILAGRPIARCTFSTFTVDNPLNRVLGAALKHIVSSKTLTSKVRRDARSLLYGFDGIGILQSNDIEIELDGRSGYYADAKKLAALILDGSGISTTVGAISGSTFLFRTPLAIEDGVRNEIRRHLNGVYDVRKKGRQLKSNRNRSLNPDLVFGEDLATGDVKYKRRLNGDIERSNLNQAATFAAGFGVDRAAVIAFGPVGDLEHTEIGDITVSAFNWDTAKPDPADASKQLSQSIATWLSE